MNNKRGPLYLLGLTFVIAACGPSVVVASSEPQTTTTASPTAASGPPRPVTTTSPVPQHEVVLRYPGGIDPTPVVTVNVPDGWQPFGDWAVLKNGGQAPTGMGFGIWSVTNAYTDRCQWSGALLSPPVGPTVSDLAAALAEVWGSDINAPTDVIVDGFAGKQITLRVPADIDFADCDSGQFRSWTAPDGGARYYQGPGQVEQNWILDVDGVRLLIGAGHFPETTPKTSRASEGHRINPDRNRVRLLSNEGLPRQMYGTTLGPDIG